MPLIRFRSSAAPPRGADSASGLVPSSVPSKTPSPSKSSDATAAEGALVDVAALLSAAYVQVPLRDAKSVSPGNGVDALIWTTFSCSRADAAGSVTCVARADVVSTGASSTAGAELPTGVDWPEQNSQENKKPKIMKTTAPKKIACISIKSHSARPKTKINRPASAAIIQHIIGHDD